MASGTESFVFRRKMAYGRPIGKAGDGSGIRRNRGLQESRRDIEMEIVCDCQIAFACDALTGSSVYRVDDVVDMGGLFDCLHLSHGVVERIGCAEQAMMRPDDVVVFGHQFGRSDGDIAPTGNHPWHDADTFRKDDGAFGHGIPEGASKFPVPQGNKECQCDKVWGMGVIDDPIRASGKACFHLMVHEMGRELGGWTATLAQPPKDPVLCSFRIEFREADIGFGIIGDIAHEFSGAGHEKKVTAEFGDSGSDIDPRAGLFLGEQFLRGFGLFGEEVIGRVSTVSFVEAETVADFAHPDKILDELKVEHGRKEIRLLFGKEAKKTSDQTRLARVVCSYSETTLNQSARSGTAERRQYSSHTSPNGSDLHSS